MSHLSELEMQQYRRRKLAPAAMLAADDHVAACEQCRRLLVECEPVADPAGVLAQLGQAHLTYEETEAYVEGLAHGIEQRRVESHLDVCRQCRAEVADLRTFRGQLEARRARRIPAWLTAAAIAIAAGVGWWWNASHRTPDLVAQALATGDLHIPEPVLGLRGSRTVVRGAPARPGFELVSPVATAVLSQTPRFTWQPMAGARGYRVAVFTAGFHKSAESAWVESTEWTPATPLERGQTYAWQVTGRLGTAEDAPTVRAPALADPEAKFQVVAGPEAADLERAAREQAGAHLLLGVLYARAGVLDAAEQELAAYVTGHSRDVRAATLLEKIRAVRR
jgi:hypothetical protein